MQKSIKVSGVSTANVNSLKTDLFVEAIRAGIVDNSYNTVCNGYVHSFAGEVSFTYKGKKYQAKGFGPHGDAHVVTQDGYVEITEIV